MENNLPPQNRTPQQLGSGFTNLNSYLNANKSNQLGQTVAGGVQQAGNSARGAINQAGQTFQTAAGQEQQRLGQAGQQVGQILSNPTKVNDKDVESFGNILGAQSKGPTGVENADTLRSKASDAEGLGRAGQSEAGRFGLLSRFVGRGNTNYNAGNQRLDNMLLGQTGQQQLRGARASTSGLSNQAEQQIGGAAAQGQELQGQARQLAESAKGQLGSSITGYDTAMQQKLADQTAGYNNIINQFKPGSNAPIEMDDATIKSLSAASNGILNEGTKLYGADISPYLSVNSLYANKQGAQSADDLAKIQALQKLSGNYLAGTDAGNIAQSYTADPTVVGQFAANPFAVSSESGLNSAITDQARQYGFDVDEQSGQLSRIANGGTGYSEYRGGSVAGNNPDLQNRLRAAYAQTQGIPAEQVQLDDAMKWAQNGAPDENAAMYQQIQKNNAGQADAQKRLAELENTYKTFRVLKKKAPAESANPIIAGPLTG